MDPMSARGPDPPQPPQSPPPAGWYADPWGGPKARWWNGDSWEQVDSWLEQANHREKRRRWDRFRSYWVLIACAAVLMAPDILLAATSSSLTLPLLSATGVALLAAVWWMDRLEPEPFDALMLCLAWGATVAGVVAGHVNGWIGGEFGSTASAVLSAPFAEEALKGLILLVLVRHRLIDSMIDGAVYAVAVAVGFSLTEDLVYYRHAAAGGTDLLLQLFAVRGILTPFGHPLFTIWMGVAAGYIVTRRPSQWRATAIASGSYLFAVALHALWNGTLLASEDAPAALWLVGSLFVVLFLSTILFVAALRRSQSKRFEQQVPALAALLSMNPAEVAVFSSTREYLRYRRSLPRDQRAHLGSLRWTLHAIASLRTIVPRNGEEMRKDSDELGHLRREADELRRHLFPAARGSG